MGRSVPEAFVHRDLVHGVTDCCAVPSHHVTHPAQAMAIEVEQQIHRDLPRLSNSDLTSVGLQQLGNRNVENPSHPAQYLIPQNCLDCPWIGHGCSP
jgi:hypothetical protein